jgi:hypothetical protein
MDVNNSVFSNRIYEDLTAYCIRKAWNVHRRYVDCRHVTVAVNVAVPKWTFLFGLQ